MSDVHELGRLLRAWRGRARPPGQSRAAVPPERRTPGLRREEVSQLASISADYLKRVEQGRARPSASVLQALGRALGLSEAEHAIALRLAGHADERALKMPREVPPGVARLVERLADPVAVFDASWTRLGQNALWTDLTGDPPDFGSRQANLVWRMFTGDTGRIRMPAPEQHRRELVADLRAVAARYPADLGLLALISDLDAVDPEFGRLWDGALVDARSSGCKSVIHPRLGVVEVDCDVLAVHGADLRIVVFSAAEGTEGHRQLQLLAG